ncbi:MAG: CPBP family intramembrane glutamic endopeptidase [Calditrichia bacterium]
MATHSGFMKIALILGEVGIFVVPYLYVRNKQLPLNQIFRWNAVPGHIAGWSFIIGLSAGILGDELDRLINMVIPVPESLRQISDVMQINGPADFILLFLAVVVAASVIEESVIRGFLQGSLERYQSITSGVIYASLAWALIHGTLYYVIQIFILGIVFGLLAWRSNSIIPSVIGHATNNAAALLFFNIRPEMVDRFYTWGNHVSPLWLVLSAAGLYLGMRRFNEYYTPPATDYRE